jgi:hypothetical protein
VRQPPVLKALPRPQALLVLGALLPLLAVQLWPALYMLLPPAPNAALHTLLETVSIVVSAMVFSVGWHTLAWRRHSTLALVCCLFAGVALADFVHTLSFDGSPSFLGGVNIGKAFFPFLVARLLAALAMLGIACAPWWHSPGRAWRWGMLGAVVLVTGALCAAGATIPAFNTVFFVPGQGLTPLKITTELVLIAMNLAAAAIFAVRLRRRGAPALRHLLAAALLMALSEVCFTRYRNLADVYFVYGHVVKVAAYLTVYLGLYVEMLLRPYEELHATQRHLAASEERWRMLFQNSLEAVLLTTPGGRVTAANPAACRLFGMSEEALLRRGRTSLTVPGDGRLAHLLQARERDGQAFGELVLRRADGSCFDAEVSSTTYVERSGARAASVFVRDITGRKAQEREILRLNTSLEQRVAQRTSELRRANADLEQLSYGVAHDLRAPLAGIGGFSGVLERELGPALNGRAGHAVRRIQANVARMDGMIESVLLLARQADAPLRPEPLDLTQLALEALQQLAGAEPARQVQAEIQPGLHAEGDPQLVHSLMENLLGNAWKFTAGTPAARIEVGARTEGGCPVFFVRDNGVGFDMAQAGRLFTVFQRLHGGAQFPGHGLGLVSARRVVERHGGRIWAEGAPGRGACIAFTLAPG